MLYVYSMWETLKSEWRAQAALVLYFLLTIWWIISLLNPSLDKTRFFGDFPSIYGVMALWGGIWGVVISKKWGFTKSIMGKSILMFSLGLFAQEFGQIVYAYLSFVLHIQIPYPSLGDVGYFGSIPLYIYGVWLLGQAAGVKIKLQSVFSKIQAIIIPLIMLSIGYLLFLHGYKFDWSNPLKIFLDFGYPLGQAIYISIALLSYLLSRDVLGGVMRNKILFILFALLIQFFSDYTFLYQSNQGTWMAGGINDFMYLNAYFLMTLGLIQMMTALKKLQKIGNM